MRFLATIFSLVNIFIVPKTRFLMLMISLFTEILSTSMKSMDVYLYNLK